MKASFTLLTSCQLESASSTSSFILSLPKFPKHHLGSFARLKVCVVCVRKCAPVCVSACVCAPARVWEFVAFKKTSLSFRVIKVWPPSLGVGFSMHLSFQLTFFELRKAASLLSGDFARYSSV